MTAESRMEYIQRFADATNAARKRGDIQKADPNLRVFLLGPVTLDLIAWVSDREDMDAISRVEREGGEFMTVMVR